MSRSPKHKLPCLIRCILWTCVCLALAILVIRIFVGDVYPVSSSSMRPTILGGVGVAGEEPQTEWVFVDYDRSPPDRFELVVLRPANGGESLVKRVLGLPGETLRLAQGDLFIDGKPLGSRGRGQRLIPLWDSDRESWREWLSVTTTPGGPWHELNGRLVLDAEELSGNTEGEPEAAVLRYQARDGYLSPAGRRVPGVLPVNDLVLTLDLVLEGVDHAADASLTLWLTEAGDVFLLTLRAGAGSVEGNFDLVLERLARSEFDSHGKVIGEATTREVLTRGALTLEGGRNHGLTFSNWDDALEVQLDGRRVLAHEYGRNRPLERGGVAEEHLAPRAGFGGRGLTLRFERIRVSRDLFWIPRGAFAVDEELLLGPNEIFVLGDNSRASTDSRSFGPLALDRVSGRVEAVIWPLARLRRL